MDLIDESDDSALFPWICTLTLLMTMNKYWASIMEKRLGFVAKFLESNRTPPRYCGVGCMKCTPSTICGLYRFYDRFWWINHWSIFLAGIRGLPALYHLSREDWLRFEKFTDRVCYCMYWNIINYNSD